jgi:hypothetical protein
MSAYVLATRDQDVCLIPRRHALVQAQRIADELNQTVRIRDPITDRIYKTVRVSGP